MLLSVSFLCNVSLYVIAPQVGLIAQVFRLDVIIADV